MAGYSIWSFINNDFYYVSQQWVDDTAALEEMLEKQDVVYGKSCTHSPLNEGGDLYLGFDLFIDRYIERVGMEKIQRTMKRIEQERRWKENRERKTVRNANPYRTRRSDYGVRRGPRTELQDAWAYGETNPIADKPTPIRRTAIEPGRPIRWRGDA